MGSDNKPFDDEPFDAGVEANEESDPKKFIEQLTGKLGQSLRKYNENNGQPDFELEKFAINSLLSATHTSEMDENDKNDIIKKVNTAGDEDKNSEGSDFNNSDNNSDDNNVDNMGSNNNFNSFDELNGEEGLEEEKDFELFEGEDLFLKEPVRCDMFQPGSNDRLKESFEKPKKNSIFGKEKILNKLHESLNQDDTMKNIETQPAEPIVKPETIPTKPSRRNKPFLPMPEVEPDPKAVDEGKWSDMMKGVRGEPANSWSLVAIENNKVVGQDIDIKISDMIPARYEVFKKQFPNATVAIENGYGQIVWSDKKYK